ncbi:MAG TPA: ferredoxin family protein, partial [Verrucomicrobiae bacterium]
GRVASHERGWLLVLGKFAGGGTLTAEGLSAETPVRFQDITGFDSNRIAEVAESTRAELGAAKHGEWKPWFPVIDYDRCTNCMQCLSFCLFGVYGVDEQNKIQAQNHDNCKTNCPACSRVCPEAAIMFPKYKAGPINGDVVQDSDMGKEKMKVDISALLGGDVYSALRQRSDAAKARFSKERDDKKALQERQKCLTKLAQGGDIPMEVLMSLPSPEEILRRAEEAKAKAAAALAKQ